MSELTHRTVRLSDFDMHIAEQGDGVPVIMCHGWPGVWYAWHHQIPMLAEAGFRAIAIDQRGLGQSTGGDDPEAFSADQWALDMNLLLDGLGADRAIFVGQDHGAGMLWCYALRHPERIRGLVQLGVPRLGRGSTAPSVVAAAMAEEHFLHLHYYNEPGPADEELNADPREFLKRVYWALSGDGDYFAVFEKPSEGYGYIDALPPAPDLPWAWMSDADFEYIVGEYTRTGFVPMLNGYRSADRTWRQDERYANDLIDVPTWFLYGSNEPVIRAFDRPAGGWGRDAGTSIDPIDVMIALVPGLRETVMFPGAGHFLQMERPERFGRHLVRIAEEIRREE